MNSNKNPFIINRSTNFKKMIKLKSLLLCSLFFVSSCKFNVEKDTKDLKECYAASIVYSFIDYTHTPSKKVHMISTSENSVTLNVYE